ncbi:YwqG family protein [Thermoflavimicrobium dichotomicum]|uniref:Uncharacterized protein YwqG n=1 Tax=Thermoflavimicrobium dichotomicum TaxID=46223 RepID=A0A1I3T1C9_9BACL|nr:YwqG family protein [Thermoflavimicrobium dichotomicum]SFJ64884.1 Uncharacterized protein YwqG [Thermoflavimicrobium dichotomicum]
MKQEAIRLIEESELLPELKPEIQKLLRFTINLELELVEPASLPPGSSKIGGRPDLPPDFEWPWIHEKVGDKTWDRPLLFVAQLNLKDLNRLKPDLFPADGILYFWDDYHGHDDGWKVWYYDGPAETLVRTANPNEEEDKNILNVYDDIRLNECRIHFRPGWMLPPTENMHLWNLLSRERLGDVYPEQEEIYEQLFNQIRFLSSQNIHRILGYPDGWEVVDMTYRERKENGTEEEWLLLLQLVDDSQATMSWGDAGCLNYWIRLEDLKNKQFQNIYRWWEQGC